MSARSGEAQWVSVGQLPYLQRRQAGVRPGTHVVLHLLRHHVPSGKTGPAKRHLHPFANRRVQPSASPRTYENHQGTHHRAAVCRRLRPSRHYEGSPKFQGTTDPLPCHIHLPVCSRIVDSHSRTAKNKSRGNEVLPEDTTHLIQSSPYQRESPCQDPAGSRTTRRPPDHRKETQTEMVWTCLPFISLAKTILQGIAKGGRRQGRQKKRWEDSFRDWTGLEFAKSQRAVENRQNGGN